MEPRYFSIKAPNNHMGRITIDVSSCTEDEISQIVQLQREYDEYLEAKLSTLFSFEDFAEHTGKPLPSSVRLPQIGLYL